MDRYFQVSWCPYKYVFLSNLGQKWTFFQFQFRKVTFCSQSGGVVGLRLGTKCSSLSVTGGRIASCNSKALMKISPSKNTLSLCIKGGGRLKNCKSYHHLKVLNASYSTCQKTVGDSELSFHQRNLTAAGELLHCSCNTMSFVSKT